MTAPMTSPFTDRRPPDEPPPRRWCRWHRDFTPDATAVLVGLIPHGPDGEPIGVYACHDCQDDHELLPYAARTPVGVVRLVSGATVPL